LEEEPGVNDWWDGGWAEYDETKNYTEALNG